MRFQNLEGADFKGANLRGTDLSSANLQRSNLEGADLRKADLRWANLQEANLQESNLEGVDLRESNLRGANLQGANLGVDLNNIGVDLRWANLQETNLRGTNFEGAILRGVNLQGSNLQGSNLEGADLSSANLEGADLRKANLKGADLRWANLEGTILPEVNLQELEKRVKTLLSNRGGILLSNLEQLEGGVSWKSLKGKIPLEWNLVEEDNQVFLCQREINPEVGVFMLHSMNNADLGDPLGYIQKFMDISGEVCFSAVDDDIYSPRSVYLAVVCRGNTIASFLQDVYSDIDLLGRRFRGGRTGSPERHEFWAVPRDLSLVLVETSDPWVAKEIRDSGILTVLVQNKTQPFWTEPPLDSELEEDAEKWERLAEEVGF